MKPMTTAGHVPSQTSMQPPTQHCPTCHEPYHADDVVCPHCRIRLLRTGITNKIAQNDIATVAVLTKQVQFVQNISDVRIVLEINHKVLSLPNLPQIVLGRVTGNGDLPDIDLSSFSAQDFGVSRQHLKVVRDKLFYVEDIGSTNGTYINGMRLAPYTQYMLRHSDTLTIGQLLARVGLYSDKPH
jgi:hypothetical protein